MILRRERRDRFTILDNAIIEDSRLSYKAVGILAYLLSRPDGWAANYRQLTSVHNDGETSVRSGLDELRQFGYLEQHKIKHPVTGKFVWECIIRETPHPVDKPVGTVDDREPCGGFPGMGFPGLENPRNSKEEEAKTEKNPPKPPQGGASARRPRKTQPPAPLTVLERSDDFEEWWKTWPRKVEHLNAVTAWRVMLGHLPSLEHLVGATVDITERTRREHHGDDQWERFIPYPSTWLRRGDYLDFDVGTATRSEARHPCVLCGVTDPCAERCQGVTAGVIEDVVTECVWRTTTT